jgi:hypothetical protein
VTEQLTEITKPKAEGYRKGRKLYLVPTFFVMAGIPDDFREKVARYWADVRSQVENMERTLTKVTRVYHESVFDSGDDGLSEIEQVNAHGHSFINVLCRSTARLEATDHREALEEAVDWRRCGGVGLVSENVRNAIRESLERATKTRYEHMATVIDETLGEDEAGLFVVNEDHQVQFPTDIQVFYISPPSLDEIKRWVGEQMRQMIAEQEAAMRQAEEAADLAGQDDNESDSATGDDPGAEAKDNPGPGESGRDEEEQAPTEYPH